MSEENYYDLHLTCNQIFRIRATHEKVMQITQEILLGRAVVLNDTHAVLFPLHVTGILKVIDHHGGKTYTSHTTGTGD